MLPIYYLAIFLCALLGAYSGQKYARSTNTAKDVLVFSLVTGVLSMGVLYTLSGFHLHFNGRTTIYALLLAVPVLAGQFIQIYAYRYMPIATGNFILTGIRQIVMPLIGVLIFGETFSTVSFVQTVLVLLMLLTLFLSARKAPSSINSSPWINLLLIVARVVQIVLSGTLCNAFANDPLVCDSHSFFFLTNVITVAVSAVALLIVGRGRPKRMAEGLTAIPLFGYAMIFLSVLASNLCSLLEVLVLREGSLVLYTPLSGALSLLATEVVAVFIVKEKPQILATVLAISSVLVVILF